MKGRIINKYNTTTKNGTRVRMYVYEVFDFTADELADYQLTQQQGGVDNYRTNDAGDPLFFTSRFEGNLIDIVKGKSYDENANLVDRYVPIGSETFELKRSMEVEKVQAAEAPRVRPNRKASVQASSAAF